VGGPIDAKGKIKLSGLTAHELAASATGTMHFDWRGGAVESAVAQRAAVGMETTKFHARAQREIPPQLSRFTSFSGDAEIAGGKITLVNSHTMRSGRDHPVDAQLILNGPRKIHRRLPSPRANKQLLGKSHGKIRPDPHASTVEPL